MPDFSLSDVLAWARTKPADEEYCYTSCGHCALAQFLRETSRCARPSIGGDYWRDASLPYPQIEHPFPAGLEGALQAGTFGQLVARLELLVQETPLTPSEWTKLDAYLNDIERVEAA